MNTRLTLTAILLSSLLAAYGQDRQDFWTKMPEPEGWVSDFDNIFTDDQKQSLDSLISDIELRTSIEFAIVTIPVDATVEERFDELTLHIARTWGVGKKEMNNGVLIGISVGYGRLRIQTGLGIEPVLTNEIAQNIIDQVFVPAFKGGNYYEGTFDGILEIIHVLSNDSDEAFMNNGTYPHFLASCAKTDGNRIECIRNWWNERKENKASIQ